MQIMLAIVLARINNNNTMVYSNHMNNKKKLEVRLKKENKFSFAIYKSKLINMFKI